MTTLPQTALAKPSRGSAAGLRAAILYLAMAALIAGTGMVMGWNYALTAINMGLISAILALGLNLQWGYAGLFNVGIMGFVALGGLAAVLVSMRPVGEAWASGGLQVVAGLVLGVLTVLALVAIRRRVPAGTMKTLFLIAAAVLGVVITRAVLNPGVTAVEAVSPASTGYLGGLGLFRVFSFPGGGVLAGVLAWTAGGVLAAGAAWIIGKTALGLRSDYLAIATLGIAEIILAVLKNEDWLARGVKNVVGIPSPVPQAIQLQTERGVVMERAMALGMDPVTASTIVNKLGYTALFAGRAPRALRPGAACTKVALGPDGSGHPGQRGGGSGHGQGRHRAASADLRPGLGHLRDRWGHDGDAGRPAHPRLVPAAALHLPGVGHGNRGRLGQQLGRGAGGLPDLVALGRGGAAGQCAVRRGDGRTAGGLGHCGASQGCERPYAAPDHGADPAPRAEVLAPGTDPGAVRQPGERARIRAPHGSGRAVSGAGA
jgi:ABC-type branched-subunit amino acid transport system permease subunit